jgi:4-hydroxy-2-oxoheptanedioate aldolase
MKQDWRMNLPPNDFKRALADGRSQIGFWVSLSHPYAAEIAAGAGFDWLVIDMEHAPNTLASVLVQLQATAAYPVSAAVRLPWNDAVHIKQVLDIGAQTLLVPFVQTAEEAGAAVAAIRYPPRGVRGVAGGARASRFGRV